MNIGSKQDNIIDIILPSLHFFLLRLYRLYILRYFKIFLSLFKCQFPVRADGEGRNVQDRNVSR